MEPQYRAVTAFDMLPRNTRVEDKARIAQTTSGGGDLIVGPVTIIIFVFEPELVRLQQAPPKRHSCNFTSNCLYFYFCSTEEITGPPPCLSNSVLVFALFQPSLPRSSGSLGRSDCVLFLAGHDLHGLPQGSLPGHRGPQETPVRVTPISPQKRVTVTPNIIIRRPG